MATPNKSLHSYSARDSYQAYSVAEEYEQVRFSGLLGRYRRARELNAISYLVSLLPDGITVVDCPCGTGRWWPVLARRARHIVALDISEGMLRFAREQAEKSSIEVEVRYGDAQCLPLPDCSVDYAFSHALTKHLPVPIQYTVLDEFARVARFGVICSFGIFSHLTYEFWRRRHLEESYPVFYEELEWMALGAGLKVQTMRKCTTPIGVEHTVLFDKMD